MDPDIRDLGDRREKDAAAEGGGAGGTRLRRVEGLLAFVRSLRSPWRLAIGVGLCLPLVAVRIAVVGFSPELPYLVFYPGVAIAAALAGSVAGVGAALVAILAGTLWFSPPLSVGFFLRLGGFLFYAVVICALAEALHWALWRLGEAEGRREAAEKLLVASERFRLAAADRIGSFDLDLVRNEATDTGALRRIFGMSSDGAVDPERMIGLVHPEDRPKIEAALAAAFDPAGDGVYAAEYRIRRENDGEPRWIVARGQTYFEAGRAVRMIGVCRDVSDLRSAELALQNSEQQIRRFVERAPNEIAMFDREMNTVAASWRWVANYGRGRDSLAGVNHYALHPDLPERWKAIHRLVQSGEFHSDDGDVWIDGDGRLRWLRWAAFPWADFAGRIGGVILSAEDISAQKQAEAALRESEEKFRNAFAGAAIGFVMAEAGGTIVEANAAYCSLTGYARDELDTMRLVDLVDPEDRAAFRILADRIESGAEPGYVVERRYRRKNGGTMWVRESASVTHDREGAPRWVVNLVEDVTERKRIEESAARTVAQLTAVLDGAKDAIIAIDVHGLVQSINAAGERMFGYERDEVIGRNVGMLMPQNPAELPEAGVGNAFETGAAKVLETGREAEGRRKDGALFPIELAITEAAVYNDLILVAFVRDLSERRRIESRMDQLAAQRLTAIGGMAGALAHELNQPLAAMGVYLETARRMLTKPAEKRIAPIEDAIARASAQVVRMGEIIARLRHFAGHGEPDKTHQNLHAVIRKVASDAISDAKAHGAALSLELNAKRDDVVMDPVQIGQVLANIVRNAREAVGEAPGGRVVISTALQGRDMIRCDVSDNGPGLAEAVEERLFEPLTSTKATGMGVGLSISKSIIEAHYGEIRGRSNPHGGAVFSVTLPLAEEESDE